MGEEMGPPLCLRITNETLARVYMQLSESLSNKGID